MTHARFIIFFSFLFAVFACKAPSQQEFVKRNANHFEVNGKPYYYIGTNYWYGPILASPGKWGDRARLLKELDLMQSMGINNLRIYVGSEGPDGEPFRVTPTLQVEPGKYNEELLDGLDFLLAEMKKRNQYAILYLNNSWNWSGGYSQYLNWNGKGEIPYPNVKGHTWNEFMQFAGQFLTCDSCKEMFARHVKFILGRTNKYTGLKYTEDPVIMTWEIGNEPRAFEDKNIPAFEAWISQVAALIKQLDKNHLVTTGTEGQHGCQESIELFERIHADKNIDYLTVHIWPKNWSWLDVKNIPGSIDRSIDSTRVHLGRHIEVANRLNKPLVLEEFGLPRDFHGYSASEAATAREKYYDYAFGRVVENFKTGGALAGANFWAFSGYGRAIPGQLFWKIGDSYMGDPPCEEQGLNSVFDTDSALLIVKKHNISLGRCK
jgi:mannan endo-1,4-beta-mannosidase